MPFPHEAILGLDFFSALVDAFLQITRGLRPLVILGNASTCAEKKSNPRIASWGKDTFPPCCHEGGNGFFLPHDLKIHNITISQVFLMKETTFSSLLVYHCAH